MQVCAFYAPTASSWRLPRRLILLLVTASQTASLEPSASRNAISMALTTSLLLTPSSLKVLERLSRASAMSGSKEMPVLTFLAGALPDFPAAPRPDNRGRFARAE